MDRRSHESNSYFSSDTVAAVVTAMGGSVSVIRVSGPLAVTALTRLSGKTANAFGPRRLVRVRLAERGAGSGEALDDALAVLFPGPDSFTGEDCVEFHLHGGAFTCSRMMGCLADLGIRQALAGEFSFRAVRNGKMSLDQAEAVADLIGAANESAVALALEKLDGSQGARFAGIFQELKDVAAAGELGIDFSEEEDGTGQIAELQARALRAIADLRDLRRTFDRGRLIQEGIRAVFVGLPNSGKSSLFNALLGEDRAIVSDEAGTTRDVIRERLTLSSPAGSVTLRVEDTAGLRDTDSRVERLGIERTREAARRADLVLFAVDAGGVGADGFWNDMKREWQTLGLIPAHCVGLLTKCDLATREERDGLLGRLAEFGLPFWCETSSKTGEGISETAAGLAAHCAKWLERRPREVLLTHREQVQAIDEAIGHLERASRASGPEFFVSDLRQAFVALAPMSGISPFAIPEEVLENVFSRFCIGK